MHSLDHAPELMQWLDTVAPGGEWSLDSRRIRAGDVFLACPSDSGDGRDFIQQAIEAGAAAILFDDAQPFVWDPAWTVPHRAVPHLASQAAHLAQLRYGSPDRDLFSVAVTGTNGKTSCTQWLAQALSLEQVPTVVVGTLGVGLFHRGSSPDFESTGYTTPDSVQLYRQLAAKKKQGAAALALEASSIGLVQGRMDALHLDVAVLTKLTRDHLDFHGSMQAYEAAKARLFVWPGLHTAVINCDDAFGLRLLTLMAKQAPQVKIIGYSVEGRQQEGIPLLAASDIRIAQQGTSFQLSSPYGSGVIRTHLIGRFNVSNLLAVAAVLFARGLSWNRVVHLLEALQAVPGRMQQLGGQDGPLAVIDYAHTPDALEKALSTLRDVAQARQGALWCVFGCGGERDPGKRPQMAAVATGADHIIITSDNPRSEQASDIIQQMVAGLNAEGVAKVQVIEDRAGAILSAIRHSTNNDVILIAGKGHEAYQEVNGRRLAFLDADHAALALATRATRFGGH